MIKRFILFIVSGIFLSANPGSNITGLVADAEIKQPLEGVNIFITSMQTGTTTDETGSYIFNNLEPGTYQIEFSYIGYQKVIMTDVVIRPGRPTVLNVEMSPVPLEMGNVYVRAGYFSDSETKPVSTVNFSSEEVRRAPGSAGDVSRILSTLPSLTKANDQQNSLIVRGGSPVENAFFIDGIEIPNINHYPTQGSSEGPIGIINIDFVDDVSFSAGGFSVENGDRLSSIMDIKFREGSMTNFYPQFNMSMAGAGFSVEGPVADGSASYLLAISKSYLDLIADAIHLEGAVPDYGDAQGKIAWKIGENDKLIMLDIYSNDYINFKYDKSLEDEINYFGTTKTWTNAGGLSWQHMWNEKGYSVLSVSHSIQNFDEDIYKTKTKGNIFRNSSVEQQFIVNSKNYLRLNENIKLLFGGGLKVGINKFVLNFGEEINIYGNTTEAAAIRQDLNTVKGNLFTEIDWSPLNRLILKGGIRGDYFDYNEKLLVSPRISATYSINDENSISASAGLYYQNIPNNVLVQSDLFKELNVPKAYHFILGYSRMLTEDTKLTLEIYDKEYCDFPVDPEKPEFFIFDEAVTENVFKFHNLLRDAGKAYSRGIELIVQKKLAKDIYGLVSGSYSVSKYKALDNKWYNRIYDNPLRFAVEGGYVMNENWEFSTRWIYAQGRPYTPFNQTLSKELNAGVIDVNRINDERVPDYHSLNIRVDRRFHFANSSLVLFLDIWNVYNRPNVAAYEWNEITNKQTEINGWTMMPIMGVEWEF